VRQRDIRIVRARYSKKDEETEDKIHIEVEKDR
jgi:hypothetical protein